MAAVKIQSTPRFSPIKVAATKAIKATTPIEKAPNFTRAPEVASIGLPQRRFRAPKTEPTSKVPAHWSGV